MEKAIIIKNLTNNQLEQLLCYLTNKGYRWYGQELSTIDNIKYYKENKIEVLYINNSYFLSYSTIKYLKRHSEFKIITLDELIQMKKSDLKPGMVVEYANNEKRLVVTINNSMYLISRASFADIKCFNEDLTYDGDPKLNIVKVYQPKEAASLSTLLQCNNCIWARPKEIVLTMQEIADKFGIPVEQLKIKK